MRAIDDEALALVRPSRLFAVRNGFASEPTLENGEEGLRRMAGIVFAGGCHVEGWPIGPEHSFVNIALQLINPEGSFHAHIVSYVNLKTSCARIAQACRETGAEYLVLQIGHYETAPVFSKILGRMFQSSPSRRRPKMDVSFEGGNSGQKYRPTARIRLFNCERMLLSAIFLALGARRKVFDPDRLFDELDSVLTDLDALQLKKVFLMSPFSVPDPVIRLCRRKAAEIFAGAAQRHECIYIDTFHLLEAGGRRARLSRYYDRFHLNRMGHEIVGRLVANDLREVIVNGRMKRSPAGSRPSWAMLPVPRPEIPAAH